MQIPTVVTTAILIIAVLTLVIATIKAIMLILTLRKFVIDDKLECKILQRESTKKYGNNRWMQPRMQSQMQPRMQSRMQPWM